MRVVTLPYINVPGVVSPQSWLKKLDFFTCILEALSTHAEVHSFHHTGHRDTIHQNGVTYQFTDFSGMSLIFPFRLHAWVKSLSPDIIIVQSLVHPWQVLRLARSMGDQSKIMVQNHAETRLRFPKGILQRAADKRIDGYFFTSAAQARPWMDDRQISGVEKIHEVMECSTVFKPSDKTEARKKIGISSPLNYIWVGGLDENKDPVTLVRAFSEFTRSSDVGHLYLVFNNNRLIKEVESIVAMNPRIRLVGEIPHDDLADWYAASDFIISTSHAEGSGIAVCEGMACGCAPLLTDIPSFRMMTDNGECGALFKPGDMASLKQTLIQSLSFDMREERKKTLTRFEEKLSPRAIANSIAASLRSN